MRELVIILACYTWLQRRWRASKTLRSALFAIIILSVILIAIVGWETYLYLLLLGLQLLFGMMFMIVQFVAIFWFMSRPRIVTVRPGESSLTLDDYWGQPALIKLVSEWVTILRGDKKFDEMGGKPIKGVLLAGPPGCGKSLAADEIVYIPGGVRKISDICVGDYVIGADGKPTAVIGVYPQSKLPIYRVVFSDGTSIRTSGDHLWAVRRRDTKDRAQIHHITTQEMLSVGLYCEHGVAHRFSIPSLSAPAQFPSRPVALDPYALGLILGDGCLAGVCSFSTMDIELIEALRSAGFGATKSKTGYDWSLSSPELRYELHLLGLMGCLSDEKFIPWRYLYNDASTRLAVLQGLLDTDGSPRQTGRSIDHITVSKQLAEDVCFIVNSLGGTAKMVEKQPYYEYKSQKIPGKLAFRLSIALPEDIQAFRLTRKASISIGHCTSLVRRVETITEDGEMDAICIRVENPDGLFATRGFALTHNTFLVRCLAGTSGIALHAIEASSFRGMFWGMDVLRVLNFVSTARNLAAEYGSAIAYIDEIDSVGMSRGGVQGGAQVSSPVGMMGGGSGALTTLLAQIDGIEREREWTTCKNIARKWLGLPMVSEGFVTFWGGTNRGDVLDPALVRPGRLSKTIQVDLPDGPGRRAIFDGYLNRITHGPINLDGIVINTQGATPALIENAVLQDAVRLARFRGADEVEQRDLESALTEQALGLANPIGDLPKEQRWQIAVHEAGHVVAVNHYAPEKRTAFVSIQRRGDSLGLTLPVNLEATYSLPLRRIAADICISLAGDIATEVVLGERWSGASGDIEHIRQRINGLIYHGVFGGIPLSYKDVPPELYKKAGEWLEEQQDKVKAVLIKKKSQVEAIANALLEKDELSSQEIETILEASKPQ